MAPDNHPSEWELALWNEDDDRLQELIRSEAPSDALHEIDQHIRHLYMLSESRPRKIDPDRAARRIDQLSAFLTKLRRQIGGALQQQEHDLSTLKWLRLNGALAVVLGAGATIAAKGPSWPKLVEKLLLIAINDGRQIFDNILQPDRTRRLSPGAEIEARQILADIEGGATDAELLKRGAQLCADLFEESFFQHVTAILYPGAKRDPSPIHRSLARLAARGNGPKPGLVSFINYNFDSLMNEALQDEGVPYECHFMAYRKIESFAPRSNPSWLHSVPVYHLHGFTPRRSMFDLRGIDFVFSTQQFAEIYRPGEETIVDVAVNEYIRHPNYVALYVGCSFTDETMNYVLADAARRFPHRPHYALLEVPKEFPRSGDTAILERESVRFTEMGVQPVWYTDYDDIPVILDGLA